ncbi:MAG: DNA translocase FtsK 4TM domain-containing protein, partial [Actinotalea sp.]|nr:DNA translocase FtsK 4TM domain-containing protein [Actinotalea sp.]
MSTRTPTGRPAARSSATRSGAPTGSGRGRGGSTRPSGRGSTAAAPPQRSLPVRIVRGVFLGSAHLVGGTARRIGHGARDLDPAHRRDGLAFVLLGLAVVVAAREWWGLSGAAGDVIHAVVAGTFGVVGVAVPLFLLSGAIRLMRHPDRVDANGRIVIGLSAIVLAVCGLVHLSAGVPSPRDGLEPVRQAGGVLGYVVAAPLEALVTVWVTVPLLVLLAVFGVLVVTATPVHQVVPRLRAAYHRATGRRHAGPAQDADDDASIADLPTLAQQQEGGERKRRRLPGRRRAALDDDAAAAARAAGGGFAGDEAFESAALTEPAV